MVEVIDTLVVTDDERPPSSGPWAAYGASAAQWDDWKWQLRNRIRDLAGLERVFTLTDAEREVVARIGGRLPVGITPYYASLIDPTDPDDPIRKTVIPLASELLVGPGEYVDPLGEDHDSAVPGLVHRYPDRVLFLVTNFCAVYCRYCTRARLVGHTGEFHFSLTQHKAAIDYIAAHPEIRDVLISGGDPLTMADDKLDQLLGALRAIPHVEFVRVGSKVPAVMPQRVTTELVRVLRKHRAWLSLHAMHPRELTPEFRAMADRVADGGVPMGSQTVLLEGVNDELPVMKSLMQGLLTCRIRPYYIYQCDPIHGSAHLRTTVSKGLEIISGLRGHTTGYAVPAYVVDAPGGGGKIQLLPDAIIGRDGDDILLRNFEGGTYRYHDPESTVGMTL
ncbi:MAG: KamA family radical SAM protein [Alphaproteobacteria bacterium]|nr:KamA family radical SAM protein [Alphaproteobacteria bacterium]